MTSGGWLHFNVPLLQVRSHHLSGLCNSHCCLLHSAYILLAPSQAWPLTCCEMVMTAITSVSRQPISIWLTLPASHRLMPSCVGQPLISAHLWWRPHGRSRALARLTCCTDTKRGATRGITSHSCHCLFDYNDTQHCLQPFTVQPTSNTIQK